MTRILVLFIFFLGCSFLNQNDLVEEIIDSEFDVGYRSFKTGIDNYRYEFIEVQNSDTIKLFTYYLNDRSYQQLELKITSHGDSIIMRSAKLVGFESVYTSDKTFVLIGDLAP